MTIAIKGTEISRRGMLAGGMSFCLALGTDGLRLVAPAQANTMANAQITPWIRIAPDGAITIFSAGAEMGQGSMTGLPVIAAEELDADWSKVKIEWAPADKNVYGYNFNNERMMQIVGSRATQLYYNDLRMAGARVRKVLIMNAAEKWGVDPATLRTEPSAVVNPANGARLSYGDIAAFGKIPRPASHRRCKGAQSSQRLPSDRPTGTAPGHAAQGQRLRAICHRRQAARHGLCARRCMRRCIRASRKAGTMPRSSACRA